MNRIGFSTGALAPGDLRSGLELVIGSRADAIELSALRLRELPGLVGALPGLNLERFAHVSVHAPSRFAADEEEAIVAQLEALPVEYSIVLHPDTIHSHRRWAALGGRLLLENLDRRRADGRTAGELRAWYDRLPDARLCLDLAHAHHLDPTMTEASRILDQLRDRVCQVHISELDAAGRHHPLSSSSIDAFSEVCSAIPGDAAFIIESVIEAGNAPDAMDRELEKVRALLSRPEPAAV